MESSQSIKIMSIGPAGGGKSCIGNKLIGIPEHFKSGKYVGSGLTKNISSITRHAFGESSKPKITHYDSPGLCDIELSIFNII